jgi:DNA-binding MarR family transcriptional regulator
MRQAVDILGRAIDARMSEHDLTDAQWRPLMALYLNSEATATSVARWVGCDSGATTRMLDRLEDKGLLRRVRSTNDRRVQQVELTEEGRKTAAIVPYLVADVLNAHLADLSAAEVDQLRDLLRRIIATGRREAEAADAAKGTQG